MRSMTAFRNVQLSWLVNMADHLIETRACAEPVADNARHSGVRESGVVAVRMMIAVAALAALAGCGSAVNSGHEGSQGNGAGMTTGGGSTKPGTSAPSSEVTVTEADSGKAVHLRIGQRLRVVLGGHGIQWHRPATPEPTLRLADTSGGYPSASPAVAVFIAVRSGSASVTSITDHPCLHANPPCKIAQRVWSIRVLVERSS
jgi:hypothetical protein